MTVCLISGKPLHPFMSLGKMPISNAFLSEPEFTDEYFYDLEVGFCEDCKMVQLTNLVEPERMFHDRYPFYSSSSKLMSEHFAEFAEQIRSTYLGSEDAFVVELGSNDGALLRHVAKHGIRHLGVEPSGNVAEMAFAQGIRTMVRYFDEETASDIVSEDGKADVVLVRISVKITTCFGFNLPPRRSAATLVV